MKEDAYLSVVIVINTIPETILDYVSSVHKVLDSTFLHYEVILVLNGHQHPDQIKKLTEISKNSKHTTVLISLAHKHSVEIAGYAGLEYAKGDYVLEIERMGRSLSVEDIRNMFDSVSDGYDIVSIVPKKQHSKLSALFYRILSRTTTTPTKLGTEYMRLVTRRALNALLSQTQRIKYRKLFYSFTGFRRSSIYGEANTPAATHARTKLPDRISLATEVFISYSTLVVKATFLLAFIFLFASILGGVYAAVIYFVKESPIEGWSTLMIFLSFGLSGIFLILGLITKYLEAILREIQSAPLYVTKEVQIVSDNETHSHV